MQIPASTNGPEQIDLSKLDLDPKNPRLTLDERNTNLKQRELEKLMLERFELEELAESFLLNGFFRQEPLLAVLESGRMIVLEGNRRLAALRLLVDGPAKWGCDSSDFEALHELYEELEEEKKLALKRPMVSLARSRRDAVGFIGFRHVTGVKTWPALEKAGYIAQLAEEHGMSAQDIAKAVGSKAAYVVRHHRAYRMLMQAREDDFADTSLAEKSFGVFMRALQTSNVSTFLGLKPVNDEAFERKPIKASGRARFAEFLLWLFGTEDKPPLITDSRRLTEFGKVLGSPESLAYLRSAKDPSFEKAYHLAGGETEEAMGAIRAAEYALRDATPHARSLKKEKEFNSSLRRCADYLGQMLVYYPEIQREFFPQEERGK